MLFGSADGPDCIEFSFEDSKRTMKLVRKQRNQSRDLGNLSIGIKQITPPLKLGFVRTGESVGKAHLFIRDIRKGKVER